MRWGGGEPPIKGGEVGEVAMRGGEISTTGGEVLMVAGSTRKYAGDLYITRPGTIGSGWQSGRSLSDVGKALCAWILSGLCVMRGGSRLLLYILVLCHL